MSFRNRILLAGVLGCSLLPARPLTAAEPPAPLGFLGEQTPVAATRNQEIADAIAGDLRQSGLLRRFSIDIAYRDGTAQLSGTVADQSQRDEVRRIVQARPGVEKVVDHIVIASSLQRVQAVENKQPDPLARPKRDESKVPVDEPQPVFSAPAPQPYDLNPPKLPPYAWPTYAPYNNYSRVACPTAYPYNAWPYIGPIYPFPKIPLGWRSVKLEWDDGYWWFSRVGTKYDWWRLRYW